MIALRAPLDSPWIPREVVLARGCSNVASILWALIILRTDDLLIAVHSPYSFVTEYVGENRIAAVVLAIASVQLLWLICQWRPRKIMVWGYALLAGLWLFMSVMGFVGNPFPYPTGGAAAPIIFILAYYGFIALGKKKVVDAVA